MKLRASAIILLIHLWLPVYSQFWGLTSSGGADNIGVIFKTDLNGNSLSVEKELLISSNGAHPNFGSLAKAADGKMYGMTTYGGKNNLGVIFEYDPTTTEVNVKIHFNGINGAYPYGSLLLAKNGKLYGMTSAGGDGYNSSNPAYGVIFEFDPSTSSYSKKFEFGGGTGANPYGSLTQGINGNLYGMTKLGGLGNQGTIFEFNPVTFVYAVRANLSQDVGSTPNGSLVVGPNGKLYGMAKNGKNFQGNKLGVLFEYDPVSGLMNNKIYFDGSNGSEPYGSLILATNGKLYGMTAGGGAKFGATIFEYDVASSTYTKKLDFSSTSEDYPTGSLFEASNGKLYGTTALGGVSGAGALFEYDLATSTYTRRFSFGGTDGKSPLGSLVQLENSKICGMTNAGGVNGQGVIFEYDLATSSFQKKVDFSYGANGINPTGSLLQASNGKFYGMTSKGGIMDQGIIFEFDPATSTYKKVFSFEGLNGASPIGSLIQARNGKLYGMTNKGGTQGYGVIFEFDPAVGSLKKKFDFGMGIDGKLPYGSLILGNNGNLYGVTSVDAAIFEFDPVTGFYIRRATVEAVQGIAPKGSLIQAKNGKIYFLASGGGQNNAGTLLEYDPVTAALVKKLDFKGSATGSTPIGSLLEGPDGKLYGMTSQGGAANSGALYAYDLSTSVLTKLYDFSGPEGGNPNGSLAISPNGKLYGLTSNGGANNLGALFEFDVTTGSYVKKVDFSGANGSRPIYTNLIFAKTDQIITFDTIAAKVVGDTPFQLFATASSGLPVSYISSNTSVATVSGNTATIVGLGTTTITAKQEGNTNYNAAPDVSQTLTVVASKQAQTITFNALPAKFLVDPPFELTATASSGLPVTYTSSNTGVATIAGSMVTIVGVGSTVIEASQGGDSSFAPAASVVQTLVVSQSQLGNSKLVQVGLISNDFIGYIDSQNAHINGNYLYTMNGGYGNSMYSYVISTFDISDPSNPIKLDTQTFQNRGGDDMIGDNDYLYVTGYQDHHLSVFSLANPGKPQLISTQTELYTNTQTFTLNSRWLFKVGNSLFLSSGLSGIVRLDASSPSSLLFSGRLSTTGSALAGTFQVGTDLVVVDDYQAYYWGPTVAKLAIPGWPHYAMVYSDEKTGIVYSAQSIYTFDIAGRSLRSNYYTLNMGYTGKLALLDENTLVVGGIAEFGTFDVSTWKGGDFTQMTLIEKFPLNLQAGGDCLYSRGGLVIAGDGDDFRIFKKLVSLAPIANPASEVSSTGFTASWTAVGVNSEYLLDISSDDFQTYLPGFQNLSVFGNSISVTGLSPNSQYSFRVRAVTGGLISPNSNVIIVNTLPKASQAITFTSPPSKTFGDPPFTLEATASSQLPVSFSSSNTAVATVSGDTLTIVGAGTTDITATQSGDATFSPAISVTQPLTVNKANQTITFGELPARAIGNLPFPLSATGGGSGLPVTFKSSNTSVATISGDTVTILKVGTTNIIASQAGNGNYNAAANVVQPLVVNAKQNQTITFNALTDRTLGDAPFDLLGTASSNLPLTYSTTSDKISITGTQVTLLKAGRASVTADQAGNDSFNAATAVTQSFCIKPAKPVITIVNQDTATPTLSSSANSGNQWFFNGSPIAGETSKTISVNDAGVYKVQVTVDGCSSDFSVDFPVVVTGGEWNVSRPVVIYPNPVKDYLAIAGPDCETAKAELFDTTGKSLRVELVVVNGIYQVDLHQVPKGIYEIVLRCDGVLYSFRILKND